MATNTRDPRSIITPEAFGIEEALLGTPLARPGRRLVALLIDLAVIGVLTAVTSGFTIFIWGAVGLFLLWVAFNRPEAHLGQVTSILFRGAAGCLGLVVILVVLALGVANRVADQVGDPEVPDLQGLEGLEDGTGSVAQVLARVASGVGGARALGAATTREEAEQAALELLDNVGSLALSFGSASDLDRDEALREIVLETMNSDPPYTDDPEGFAGAVVETWLAREVQEDTAEVAVGPPSDSVMASLEAQVSELDEEALLDRYRAGLGRGLSPAGDPEMALLRRRLAEVVAGDTLAALDSRLAEESRIRRRTEERLASVRRQLTEEENSFAALLRDIWDQAGSAVGLWSLYFTVTLTLFRGFTLGKRLMGIRVVRLDGRPITWWSAFERAGGYVAGIATGTLGFLQVFWDPNRQCVHDKIGHTAVVVAGASPDRDALTAAWGDRRPPSPPARRPPPPPAG